MSEQFKHNDSLSPAPDEQDVVALIKKMQKQLVCLETKIDLLINQSSDRTFSGKHFPKPFRSFGRSHHHSDRATGDAAGEKRFDRGSHFKKHHSEENRGFGYKKKSYGDSRESDFGQARHFARRNDGQKEGFDQKKKPFPYKQKGRG